MYRWEIFFLLIIARFLTRSLSSLASSLFLSCTLSRTQTLTLSLSQTRTAHAPFLDLYRIGRIDGGARSPPRRDPGSSRDRPETASRGRSPSFRTSTPAAGNRKSLAHSLIQTFPSGFNGNIYLPIDQGFFRNIFVDFEHRMFLEKNRSNISVGVHGLD